MIIILFISQWRTAPPFDLDLSRFPGFDAPGLRVGNIPEDEDLLNVALWEERASKQWCGLALKQRHLGDGYSVGEQKPRKTMGKP